MHSVWRGMNMSLLRVENLRTYFDTRSGVMKAVDGINLDVREGRTLGSSVNPAAARASPRSRSCV